MSELLQNEAVRVAFGSMLAALVVMLILGLLGIKLRVIAAIIGIIAVTVFITIAAMGGGGG